MNSSASECRELVADWLLATNLTAGAPLASYLLAGPLLSALVLLGLAGNLGAALVVRGGAHRPRVYAYLAALAGWDSALLVSSWCLYGLPVLVHGRFGHVGAHRELSHAPSTTKRRLAGPYVVVYPFFYALSNAAHSASVWTVVLLSLERYFAMCHPLRYLGCHARFSVRRLMLVLSALAVAYNLSRYFELRVLPCPLPLPGSQPLLLTVVLRSDLHESFWYR